MTLAIIVLGLVCLASLFVAVLSCIELKQIRDEADFWRVRYISTLPNETAVEDALVSSVKP